ncbi:MAG TPA: hypothetical protein ENI53_01375 [Thermoplasmatales archaeon]|nr:hypothetical protein [Thermoplasmatales archaeon]
MTRKKKKKNFIKEHPLLFYIILIIAILAALNFALLLPSGVTGIFYEIEHFLIRLFLLPVTLHRIELLIIIFIVAVVSYFVIPIFWIPSTDEAFIYRSTWSDGRLRYFKRWNGEIIAVNEDWLAKKWLKYVLLGEVESINENEKENMLVYESKEMEVTKALIDQDYIKTLEERIENLEKDLATGKQIPPEIMELLMIRKEEKQ